MKYIIKNIYSIVAITVMLTTGCDGKLDVMPTQSIDESVALGTSKDVEALLIGSYDGLQDADLYGGGFQVTSELLAAGNELLFGGTYANLLELYNKTITTSNASARDIWIDSYNTINRVNNVLSALTVVDEAKRAKVEGEALFIRGSLYFELVRIYGKTWGDGDNATNPGVPLVLTPTTLITDDNKIPRNSVAEVYAQALADLTKAKAQLPSSNGIYANKNTVTAQLSRIYLAQGNFAAARDAANEVILTGSYKILPLFASNFSTFLTNNGSNPEEYIFSMIVTAQDGVNAMNTYFGTTVSAIPGTSGRSDIRISAAHRQLYEAGDVRGAFFITPSNNTFTRKHLDTFGNVLIFRLAEMYLTRAEANFRLGTVVGATPLADLNVIRTRAGLAAASTATLESILKERHLELAFEGQNLHDIKRNKQSVGAFPYNSPKLILPIPQRETDVNPKLVQNEGYN